MAKITLDPVKTGFNLNQINANFDKLVAELQNKVLYRDNPNGEPNQWENQQDANSNRLINLPDAVSPSEPATLRQINALSVGVQSVGISRASVSATDGQTVFATSSYVPGSNNLSVYINGVRQDASAYTETSATSFTLSEGVNAGDNVEYLINEYPELTGTQAASSVTYTLPATGAVSRNVQAVLEQFISVKDFGATGDGVTDDSVAVQAAIDHAATLENATIFFPPSANTYIVNNLNVDGDHVNLDARSAYLENNSSNSMFILGDTSSYRFGTLAFGRILNRGGAGHVFENKGGLEEVTIYADRITNGSTGSSIFKSLDTDGGSLFFCSFEGKFWNHSASATVPAFDIEGATNTCSGNQFVFLRADRCGTAPYFSLKCTGAGQFFYNNRIETEYEVVNGGAIHLFGCSNTSIRDGNFYDLGTTTDDLIKLSSSGSGNPCRGTLIENVSRNSGTLGGGFYDVNLDDATNTTIINSGAHSPAVGVSYNLNNKTANILTPLNITFTGRDENQRITEPTQGSAELTISGDTLTLPDTGNFFLVDTEADAASDTVSQIDGGWDGREITLMSAVNARDTTFTITGGNLELAGGLDFILTRTSDVIKMIYSSTLGGWAEVTRSDNQT